MKRALAAIVAMTALRAVAFDYCDDVAAVREMQAAARDWRESLRKKRYDELEEVFGAMLQAVERGAASDAKLELALHAFEYGEEWRNARHRDWVESNPNSAAGHLARAHYHLARGMSARGEGEAPLSDEELSMVRTELQEARDEVVAADRSLKVRSLSDALRVRIAAAEAGPAAAASVAHAALAASPRSVALRMAEVDASRAEWGGRRQDLIAVSRDARGLSAADRRYLDYLAYMDLGHANLAKGDREAAARDFSRAEPLCPAFEYAASETAKIYLDQRKYAAAIAPATHVVQKVPKNGLGYAYRGRALHGLGRDAEAVKDFQRAVELGYMPAFAELAEFYETGTAVPRDLAKALELYTLAEARNVQGAGEGADRVRAAIAKATR